MNSNAQQGSQIIRIGKEHSAEGIEHREVNGKMTAQGIGLEVRDKKWQLRLLRQLKTLPREKAANTRKSLFNSYTLHRGQYMKLLL